MHPIVWQAIAWGGLFAINRLRDWASRERPRNKPDAPQRFDVARTDDGTPLPLVYGRCRVDSPILTWSGNYTRRTVALGGVAYGLDMVFCCGIPPHRTNGTGEGGAVFAGLRSVYWGDKRFTFTPLPLLTGKTSLPMTDLSLFGGDGNGGGLNFRAQFWRGDFDQVIPDNSDLKQAMSKAGVDLTLVPDYRHQLTVAILATSDNNRSGIGESPNLPQISFEIEVGIDGAGVGLPFDANPAWVLRDVLTSPIWKLGILDDEVDYDSFAAAATTLRTERHGFSRVFYEVRDAREIVQEIVEQTDGVLYRDPTDDTIRFKLNRAFDPDDPTIREMNLDNTLGGQHQPELQLNGWDDTVNEVIVTFLDREKDYKQNSVRAQKLANIAGGINNRRRSITIDYPGCTSKALAEQLAARELYQQGRPLMAATVHVNRTFYRTRPGDVVKANWPAPKGNGVVGVFFRVLEVDLGQLADRKIRLRLIEDASGYTVGAFPAPPDDTTRTTLLPIRRSRWVVDESPYLLSYFAALYGAVNGIGVQRLFAVAAAEGDPDPSNRYRIDTQAGGGGYYGFPTGPDIGPQGYPATAVVVTDYPRTLEPYDDTTGMVVEYQGGVFPGGETLFNELAATPDQIRFTGANLFLVGGASVTPQNGMGQTGEIIACESITPLGAEQYRLNNVWRGLPDTAPIDHPAGTRLFLLQPGYAVGQRDWITGQYARGFAWPLFGGVSGSDGLSYSSHDVLLTVAGRRFLPLRAADMRLAGYDMDGTHGPQAEPPLYPRVGEFKALSRLEGAFDVDARQNRIDAGVVVRGDEDGWTAEPGTTWAIAAQKVGSEADTVLVSGLTAPSTTGLLLAGELLGHGDIKVRLDSYRNVGTDGYRSWQSPEILVEAPHWRDLLANSSFEYGALTPGWTVTSGSASIQSGLDSLPRYPAGGYWVQSSSSVTDLTIKQTVDVAGYKPVGLTAHVSYYARNFGGGSESVAVTLRALDASNVELTSDTDSVAGPADHWQRDSVSIICPAGTAKLAVEVTIGSGDGSIRAGATRIRLQLGQMSNELLTNPSFEGALTGWTSVVNSFVVHLGHHYASRTGVAGSATGGAFSTSEIKQEVSVPPGYEYGTALLQLARSTMSDGDDGEVVIEALASGGSVLASATTGAENDFPMGLETWERRRLALQLPDAATTLRVRLIATRSAGSGDSGAAFDDLSLRVHKDIDPVFERDFDFTTPSWQPAPKTWQECYLAFADDGVPAPFMSWDGSAAAPTVQLAHALSGPTFAWSDASSPTPASFRGYWDIGPHALYPDATGRFVLTTEAYQFTRAIAGSAVDLQASGADDTTGDEYGAFERTEPFTVAVLFRTDELAWSTAAGLAGRRGNTGIGWGVRIDASGHLQVVMQGASGTATVTGTSIQADRAPHWVFLVNDASANTLRLYTDKATDWMSASTSSIGSLAASGAPLRIGRDGPASGTGGVQIARVFVWDVALTAPQVASMLRYGLDPSGLLSSWTSNQAVWVEVPDDSSIADGTALLRFSAHHVPIGELDGYGVVTASASTNKVPTSDFTAGATWSTVGPATLTQGIVDCTGLRRGVRVTTAGGGLLKCGGITMGSETTLSVVFFARTIDGASRTLGVGLYDTDDLDYSAASVSIGATWQRYHVTLPDWEDTTPTGYLLFGIAGSGTFDLAHVMWSAFGTDAPLAIQDGGVALNGAGGGRFETLPLQLNREGELMVEGRCSTATPAENCSLVTVDFDDDTPGMRGLITGAAGVPSLVFYDASDTLTSQSGSAIDWSQGFTLRGRWNRLELPESAGDQIGLVVADSSTDSATYDPVSFVVFGTALAAIHIGGDPTIGGAPNAIVHHVVVRAREEKLA